MRNVIEKMKIHNRRVKEFPLMEWHGMTKDRQAYPVALKIKRALKDEAKALQHFQCFSHFYIYL